MPIKLPARDHKGQNYQSLKDMYDAYGLSITYSAFLKRLDAGWSIQECLEGRIRKGKQIVYQKTLFRSIIELCRTVNISPVDFSHMLKKYGTVGMTVEKCRQLQQKRERAKEQKKQNKEKE